ncbi:MAG TPA: tetratricopeptide repeat protein, partial [Kiritimatiellia bacterium]
MTASTDTGRQPDARSNILGAVLLLLLVLAAFGPALHAGFIWDDDMFITDNETLQDVDGLRVIWTEPAKNPHYYPLLMTLFWAMYQLWGNHPAGYHLVTVLFHAGAAMLLWRLLLAVGARGAFLAALVFALHPVHVQSVAWATELKNTLSGAFYIGALLAWAREDRLGRTRAYALCAALFLASLLSKTTTISLPLAIVLIELWKQGRLRRATLGLALGLVVVALIPALVTLGLERSRNVSLVASQFLFPEKLIVVGLSIWFYLGKLLWPHPLIMVYPYWQLDMTQWREYVPLVLLVVSVPVLFLARMRLGRGPLLAWFFFIATLAPIPFMDVNFVLQHSFVADHFLYLPSLGVIAVIVSALSAVFQRRTAAWRFGLAGLVAVGLGGLTWSQCRHYEDQEALWRHTLAYNPTCAVAFNNLGLMLLQKGQVDEAIDVIGKGIEGQPEMPKFHSNLAVALRQRGDERGAAAELEKAIQLDPTFYEARLEVAALHIRQGDLAAAASDVRGAVQVRPGAWEAPWNLGVILLASGNLTDAMTSFEKALALRA